MFTGIITALGDVRDVTSGGDGQDMRATIGAPPSFLAASGGTAVGASIACSGCCLTVTGLGPDWFSVDVSAESLACTSLGEWRPGTRVNLERAMRLGDEVGGHMVTGHVDGVGRIVAVSPEQGSLRITVQVPEPLHRFVAPKGSVALDGVSLTVNEVSGTVPGANAQMFGVNLIPHTAAHTTLGAKAPGDPVHLEIDMMARYVARLVETQEQSSVAGPRSSEGVVP